MPLFKHRQDEFTGTDNASDTTSPTRKGSIFSSSSRRSPPENTTNANNQRSGFFNRRRSSSTSSDNSSPRHNGSTNGFFGMGGNKHGDPSILAARSKVTDAENAEKEADRALIMARQAVRDAKNHVRMLEQEAEEDARRAKAKQAEAKVVSKSARGLGRHG